VRSLKENEKLYPFKGLQRKTIILKTCPDANDNIKNKEKC
jgi:hypothetical protein